MVLLIPLLIGYLVGSFPTGYLAVRLLKGKDIRTEGSGKTGGFNTYTVTNSTSVAVGVGIVDAVKGLVASVGALMLWPSEPTAQGAAIVGALLGHNYPVWLKFKGGRGLATVAGALLALSQFLLLFWCAVWFVTYRLTRDILKGNLAASTLSIPAVWLIPDDITRSLMAHDVPVGYHARLITIICVLLLIGHQDAVRDLLKKADRPKQEPQ